MKLRSVALRGLLVGVTLLAMSGACSQYKPGPWEGGGRSVETPTPGSAVPPTADAGPPDTFVPPDVFVPDTGGKD